MTKIAKSSLDRGADTEPKKPTEKKNQPFVKFDLFHCYVFYFSTVACFLFLRGMSIKICSQKRSREKNS